MEFVVTLVGIMIAFLIWNALASLFNKKGDK